MASAPCVQPTGGLSGNDWQILTCLGGRLFSGKCPWSRVNQQHVVTETKTINICRVLRYVQTIKSELFRKFVENFIHFPTAETRWFLSLLCLNHAFFNIFPSISILAFFHSEYCGVTNRISRFFVIVPLSSTTLLLRLREKAPNGNQLRWTL